MKRVKIPLAKNPSGGIPRCSSDTAKHVRVCRSSQSGGLELNASPHLPAREKENRQIFKLGKR